MLSIPKETFVVDDLNTERSPFISKLKLLLFQLLSRIEVSKVSLFEYAHSFNAFSFAVMFFPLIP